MIFDRFLTHRPPPIHYTPTESTEWTGVTFSYSGGELTQSIADARRLAHQPDWDLKDLTTALKASKLTKAPVGGVPETIDFTKMRSTIRGLSGLTARDGLERGKNVYLDLTHTQLVMGATNVGEKHRVEILNRIPSREEQRTLIPVFDIHTHPTNWRNERRRLHFSPADLRSLMKLQEIAGSLVIARDSALFALKSANTSLETPVPEWFESKDSSSLQGYTREACKALGLTLYVLHSRRDWVARRVDLNDRPTSGIYRVYDEIGREGTLD